MKFAFKGIVDKSKEVNGRVTLPFNVWEVSRHRDNINALMSIDGSEMMDCVLYPLEKGKYEIDVTHFDKEVPDGEHEFVLRIPASLPRLEKPAKYDFEHPIRKIDKVDIIIQPEDGLCGQTCVAMLAGVTIQDVMDEMQCREWQATMSMIVSTLNHYGIKHADTIYFTGGADVEIPKCAVLMEKMGRFSHYLVAFDGKFYDPNLGVMDSYDTSKLVGYLEVEC